MVFSHGLLPRGQTPRSASEGIASPRWSLPASWTLKLMNVMAEQDRQVPASASFCPGMASCRVHKNQKKKTSALANARLIRCLIRHMYIESTSALRPRG